MRGKNLDVTHKIRSVIRQESLALTLPISTCQLRLNLGTSGLYRLSKNIAYFNSREKRLKTKNPEASLICLLNTNGESYKKVNKMEGTSHSLP